MDRVINWVEICSDRCLPLIWAGKFSRPWETFETPVLCLLKIGCTNVVERDLLLALRICLWYRGSDMLQPQSVRTAKRACILYPCAGIRIWLPTQREMALDYIQ
jgi:hypothetical protein